MSSTTHRTTIFEAMSDVPAAPTVGELQVSGLSVIFYTALRLREGALAAAAKRSKIIRIVGENSYADKLIEGEAIFYSELLPAGRLPGELAFAAHARADTVPQALVWLDDEYAISVVPLVFSTGLRTDSLTGLELSRPLALGDVLEVLRVVTDERIADRISRQAVATLVSDGIVRDQDVKLAWPLHTLPGIQIWDLSGTHRAAVPYEGVNESRRFCWEISTLMAHATDHVVYDGLWRRRSRDQVFNDVGSGFTVLGDHMVFLNSSCCLEISHLPINLRPRSEFRMKSYGYDSSSIFVWTVANLRLAVTGDLANRYRTVMEELVAERSISTGRHVALSKDYLRHSALIARITGLPHLMREFRNRVFYEEISRLRMSDDSISTTGREMERVVQLATDLSRARDQFLQAKSNTLLAALAAGLAIGGIPQLVEQVATWANHRDWPKLGISGVLSIVIAGAIFRIWRRYH
jgi:hypothetical protein